MILNTHSIFFNGCNWSFFTSIYTLRLLVYVFHRDNLADEKVIAHIHESPLIMILPLGNFINFCNIFWNVYETYFY